MRCVSVQGGLLFSAVEIEELAGYAHEGGVAFDGTVSVGVIVPSLFFFAESFGFIASSVRQGAGLPRVTLTPGPLGVDVGDVLDLDTPPIVNKPVF